MSAPTPITAAARQRAEEQAASARRCIDIAVEMRQNAEEFEAQSRALLADAEEKLRALSAGVSTG